MVGSQDMGMRAKRIRQGQANSYQVFAGISERANMNSVELFAGGGGLGLGLGKVGFNPIAVIEWDKWCCDTLRENKARKNSLVMNWPIHQMDVRKFDYKSIKDEVTLVSGGPPCQPFSMGGKHKGYRDDRDMFPAAIQAVRDLQPEAFVFENVKGLTRSSFHNYLQYIKLRLEFPEIEKRTKESWMDHLGRLEFIKTSSGQAGLTYQVVSRQIGRAHV